MTDQEKPLHRDRAMIVRGMEEDVYPPGPENVRPDLTRPSAAYRRHAYLAVAGVMLFLVAYAGAALWFAVTAYRLFSSIPRGSLGVVLRVGGGIASAFMAV